MFECLDGYAEDEIKFIWLNETPIQINKELEMAQFKMTRFKNGECTSSYITGLTSIFFCYSTFIRVK